ncbi:MAG: NADH:flavin oxidoreductase [Bacillota bacterium]|nr:NADH:flavin oxidoreductase [Bacillota bacterium]
MQGETGLLTPLQVRTLRLRNRIVMPPMANNRATLAGDVTDAIIEHYAYRASGVGLVIVEHSYVTQAGRANPSQLGINEDSNVPGLMRLVAAIRGAGTACAIQITHAGSRTTEQASGFAPEGPSAVAPPQTPGGTHLPPPRELSTEDIAALTTAFAQAARRARRAGFGAVEIHGAHGYLLNQFMSPLTNDRGDAYGGDRGRRLRFPLEVVAAVRAAVGPDYPIWYRLGADDMIPGGLTVDDAVYAAPVLAGAGVDVLDISGGMLGSRPPGLGGEGYLSHLSRAVKEAVPAVPVMVTGGIVTPGTADRLIRERYADLVGIGRALLADPEWAIKAAKTIAEPG